MFTHVRLKVSKKCIQLRGCAHGSCDLQTTIEIEFVEYQEIVRWISHKYGTRVIQIEVTF